MVIITAIYVIATIFICRANIKSAKASQEQVDELRRQYLEENRPRIEVEFTFQNRCYYGLRFVNRGRITAQDVSISFDDAFLQSIKEKSFTDQIRKQSGRKCIIGVNGYYDLFVGSNELRDNDGILPAKGKITFQYNGQEDVQDFYVDIANYMTIYSVDGFEEKLLKKIGEQTKVLEEIKKSLSNRIG